MKVFLKTDVKGVGRKGEIKNVSDGFALNNLIPKGLVVAVTKENKASIDSIKTISENHKKAIERSVNKTLDKAKDLKITFSSLNNDGGHLFAAISEKDIRDKLSGSGVSTEGLKLEIEQPIKETGLHKIRLSAGDRTEEVVVEVQ